MVVYLGNVTDYFSVFLFLHLLTISHSEIADKATSKKRLKEWQTARHVLKFLSVILDQELMRSPIGIKIIEKLQSTHSCSEHESVKYAIESDIKAPVVSWKCEKPLQSEQGCIRWQSERERNFCLFLDAKEFVQAVLDKRMEIMIDQVRSNFSSESICHLIVLRLEAYLTNRAKQEFKEDFQTGNVSISFSRADIDRFLMQLTVENAWTKHKDAKDEDEVAEYVHRLSLAIARQRVAKSESSKWMTAKGTRDTKAVSTLLTNHPLNDGSLECLTKALQFLPSIPPSVAYTLATEFGSLGAALSHIQEHHHNSENTVARLANMQRVGTARATRIGPKAAQQFLELMTSQDPDQKVIAEPLHSGISQRLA